MYQIDMQKFGSFLITLRKEKNLTQKELGERLFVSDKTVSKWERGQSIPNVSLLIPIADLLDVTVMELLKGERIQNDTIQNKRKWRLAYYICLIITVIELVVIYFVCGSAIFQVPVLYFLLWILFDLENAGMMAAYTANFVILPLLLGMLAVIYVVGRKYK